MKRVAENEFDEANDRGLERLRILCVDDDIREGEGIKDVLPYF